MLGQYVVPVGHELTHVPPTQRLPEVQTNPQAPQLVLVVVEVSQPLEARVSQSAKPATHEDTVHAPALHPAIALVRLHVLLQVPQENTEDVMFTSQPFAGLPSQSPKPTAQVPMAHTPSVQTAVELGRLHRWRQEPQFATSVLRFVSHPFDATPSQSA